MLFVQDNLIIPDSDLHFFTARSDGPGGQHVNTTNSRVCVRFSVAQAGCLTKGQAAVLQHRLKNRITRNGDIILCSTSSRSQKQNKEEVRERLAQVLRTALTVRKKRVPTKISKSAHERRINFKKKRSKTKQSRGRVKMDE